MLSADIPCKQVGPRSGWTKSRSGSKLFDTLTVYLKEFFQNINFEKNQQTTKKHVQFFGMQRVNSLPSSVVCCRPLQTVWTQIRPDKMSGLIWIQTTDTMMVFPKVDLKKSADDKTRMQNYNYPVGKELTIQV